MENIKFRASELSNIISKSGKVTQGIETFLIEKYVEIKYNRKKEISSKYYDKGIACEQHGFDMFGKVFYPNQFVFKEKERIENDYITGICDHFDRENGVITDIKNAWDLFTFHKVTEISWEYEWQLKAYMYLYDTQKARLFYCLNDLPEKLLEDEYNRLFYAKKQWYDKDDPDFLAECEKIKHYYTFQDIPINEKIKVFEIERSEEDDKRIISAVEKAREFLKNTRL